MPVHIKRLRCRVTVKTGGRDAPAAHHPEGPKRPSLHFALPEPEPRAEATPPEPAHPVKQEPQAAAPQSEPEVRKADPRAVADRVYELMRQEIALSRQRGGDRRTG